MGCGSSFPNIPYDERTRDMFDSGADPNAKVKRKVQKKKPNNNPPPNIVNYPNDSMDEDELPNINSGRPPMRKSSNVGSNYNLNRSNNNLNRSNISSQRRSPNESFRRKNVSKKQSANSSMINNKNNLSSNIPGLVDENIIKNPDSLSFTFYCTQTIPAHSLPVTCLIQLSNECIASCSLDQTIKIWEKTEGGHFTLQSTLNGHNAGVLSIKEIPPLTMLVSGSMDKTVKLWDLNTLECIGTLKGHTMCVLIVEMSTSLNYVFSAGDDTTIRIWSIDDYSEVQVLEEHKKSIAALVYIDHYSYLVSGSDDMMIKFYNSKSNFECVKTITTIKSEIDCLKYAKNRVLASCEDGNIYFINVKILKRIRSVQFTPHAVHDFFVMDHEKYLVCGSSDAKGRVWRIGSSERSVLIGHNKEINGIVLLKDGRIASASADKTIRIWEANEYHPGWDINDDADD